MPNSSNLKSHVELAAHTRSIHNHHMTLADLISAAGYPKPKDFKKLSHSLGTSISKLKSDLEDVLHFEMNRGMAKEIADDVYRADIYRDDAGLLSMIDRFNIDGEFLLYPGRGDYRSPSVKVKQPPTLKHHLEVGAHILSIRNHEIVLVRKIGDENYPWPSRWKSISRSMSNAIMDLRRESMHTMDCALRSNQCGDTSSSPYPEYKNCCMSRLIERNKIEGNFFLPNDSCRREGVCDE
jgi:hypothetical protein